MIKYRIGWKSKETGAAGYGQPVFNSKEMAQKTSDDMNRDDEGLLIHWIESVHVDPEEESSD